LKNDFSARCFSPRGRKTFANAAADIFLFNTYKQKVKWTEISEVFILFSLFAG